jgi:hypothetical protein
METYEVGVALLGLGVGGAFVGVAKDDATLTLLGTAIAGAGGILYVASAARACADCGGEDAATFPGDATETVPAGTAYDARVDQIIREAISYAQRFGYTISDRGSYHSPVLMTVDPMGAVVFHSSYQTCTWSNLCDYPDKASKVLGVTPEWVDAFHAGFKRDRYNFDLPDVYAYGLSYRKYFLGDT